MLSVFWFNCAQYSVKNGDKIRSSTAWYIFVINLFVQVFQTCQAYLIKKLSDIDLTRWTKLLHCCILQNTAIMNSKWAFNKENYSHTAMFYVLLYMFIVLCYFLLYLWPCPLGTVVPRISSTCNHKAKGNKQECCGSLCTVAESIFLSVQIICRFKIMSILKKITHVV